MIEVQGIDKVVAFVGPYRNLTTLTAGIYSLHPEVQVWNHGGVRVFGTEGYEREVEDWTEDYSREKFNKFVQFALKASKNENGQQGKYGGSITKSHAFFNSEVEKRFYDRFPEVEKPNRRTLVWKESHRLTNRIKDQIDELVDKEECLHFLMPIRNPMDVATSSVKFRFENFYDLDPTAEPWEILDGIFDLYEWYFANKEKYPERFTHFFEFDNRREIVNVLQYAGDLCKDDQWIADAMACFDVKPSYYDYSEEMILKFEDRIMDLPNGVRHQLREFVKDES